MKATYLKTTTIDGKRSSELVDVEIPRQHVAMAIEAGIRAAHACGLAGGEMPNMANAATDEIMRHIPDGLPPSVMQQPANAIHRWIRREASAHLDELLRDLDVERAVSSQLEAIEAGAGL